jgi:peptidoglycan hydrolase CwlO-like protein
MGDFFKEQNALKKKVADRDRLALKVVSLTAEVEDRDAQIIGLKNGYEEQQKVLDGSLAVSKALKGEITKLENEIQTYGAQLLRQRVGWVRV